MLNPLYHNLLDIIYFFGLKVIFEGLMEKQEQQFVNSILPTFPFKRIVINDVLFCRLILWRHIRG